MRNNGRAVIVISLFMPLSFMTLLAAVARTLRAAIIHVADADMNATYSAYIVAEHHTVNNTDNSDTDANGKHNHVNYTSNNYVFGQ